MVRMGELRASIGITRAGDDLIGTPRERDLFFRAGVGRQQASEEAYRRGFAALRRAAELAPDELALGRDAAGLAVYRVPSEIQWARTELARLVDLGASQLEDPDLDAERRFALEEAWGDAHEMLGVIQLEVDLDPLAARRWFERSLAIGPVRRAEIIDHYLPRCAELEARQR